MQVRKCMQANYVSQPYMYACCPQLHGTVKTKQTSKRTKKADKSLKLHSAFLKTW